MDTSAGTVLRTYRQEKGLTCAELAQQLGVKESTLRSLENGTRPITPERAKDIEDRTAGELTRQKLRPDFFPPAPNAQQVAA